MPHERDALTPLENAIEEMIAAAESGDPDRLQTAVMYQREILDQIHIIEEETIPDLLARLNWIKTRNDLAGCKIAGALSGVRRRRAALSTLKSGTAATYGRDGQISVN